MRFSSLALCSLLALLGCGEGQNEPQLPTTYDEPPWLVLRVDTVEVSPLRPGTSQPWDGIEPDPTDGIGCGFVGRSITSTEAMTGAGESLLCSFDARPRVFGRDVRYPDLLVLLGIEGQGMYRSPTAHDTAQFAFYSELILPTNTIPKDGISLAIADRDGANAEIVGGVRLLRRELIEHAANAPVFSVRGGSLLRMDLSVLPYAERIESAEIKVEANQGGALVPIRPVRAGEVVEVEAHGHYRIGSARGGLVDPRGYFEDDAHDPNLNIDPFRKGRHGAAIATIGGGDARTGVLITPCARFVARTPGLLWVGINDAVPSNNEGDLTFTVKIFGPMPEEWTTGKTNVPCSKK